MSFAMIRGLRGYVSHFAVGQVSRLSLSSSLPGIFRRCHFTSSPFVPHRTPPRRSIWPYVGAAGVATGAICLLSNKAKAEGARPLHYISAKKYQATCYNPMPVDVIQRMQGKSYKDGCPIPLSDLAYLRVTHYDMAGNIKMGELVVHREIAVMVMKIFEDIFAAKFPIEKMRLIDDYDADDEHSMEDNNSSAFCYRSITGRPGVVSMHGLGLAIDINTRFNPYVKGTVVAPSNAHKYVDRSLNEPGMIHEGSPVVDAFLKRGFKWGGHWTSLKDYQHFEYPKERTGIVVASSQ